MDKEKTTVLVVEDDGILSKVLSSGLKETGYNVLTANNGKDGLELALEHHPTVICLDLIMPIMGGFEMLDKLRKDDWGVNVYVFLLTNQEPTDELITESMRMPYRSEYIIKSSVDIDEVVKMVEKRVEKELKA